MYDGNPGKIDFGSSYRESTVLYFKKGLNEIRNMVGFSRFSTSQLIASRGISNALIRIEVNLLELITLSNSDLFLQSGQGKTIPTVRN